MNDIQFHHEIWDGAMGGQTVCIDMPSKAEFLTMIADYFEFDSPITLDVGITYCHSKELYNKKIGRQLSKERLESSDLQFCSVTIIDDLRYFKLKNSFGVFTFRVNPKSDRVWFTEVF